MSLKALRYFWKKWKRKKFSKNVKDVLKKVENWKKKRYDPLKKSGKL